MTTIYKISDTSKRSYLGIIRIHKGKKLQVKGIENTFSEIVAKNLPNLGKYMHIYVQEAFRISSRPDQERVSFLVYIIVELPQVQDKEGILKFVRET